MGSCKIQNSSCTLQVFSVLYSLTVTIHKNNKFSHDNSTVQDIHISHLLFKRNKRVFLKYHFSIWKGKRRVFLLFFQSVFVTGMNLKVLISEKLIIVNPYEQFWSRTLISLKICYIKSPNCRISIYFQNEKKQTNHTPPPPQKTQIKTKTTNKKPSNHNKIFIIVCCGIETWL